jgi:hypothetical protein
MEELSQIKSNGYHCYFATFFNKTQMNLIYNKIQKKYLSILNRLTITSKVTSLFFNEYILITVNFLLIPLLVR